MGSSLTAATSAKSRSVEPAGVVSGHLDPDGAIADDHVRMMIRFLAKGRNLIHELDRAAKRWELPGADEHVSVPLPFLGPGQPFDDLGFTEFLHKITLIRSRVMTGQAGGAGLRLTSNMTN